MDKSETYIKQCDCEEIQGKWGSDKGDFYFIRDRRFRPTKVVDVYDGGGHALLPRDANYGWLPRQDQIQEMMGVENYGKYWSFTGNDKLFPQTAYYMEFDSWEKCWLAFYMSEKHSKTWDGEKWVGK